MYDAHDLALVIPTKDRPREMAALLESLGRQSVKPGRIIVVDGGESIRNVVDRSGAGLEIDYIQCHPPGQIRQRLAGLARVEPRTALVGFIDDDILFEPDAIEKVLEFWNRAPANTGGVAMNLTNVAPHKYSRLRALIGLSGKPGEVLRSGYNISVANQRNDIETKWLPGGVTTWRLEVVKAFPQEDLKTKWAAGEDVRFSYPIGKHHPLFVCAGARVVDTGQTTKLPAPERARFQGRKECLAYCYFVELHPELSKLRCMIMVAASAATIILKGIFLKSRSIHRGIGQIEALIQFSKAIILRQSVKQLLED